jgi:cobalt/nickel transport system permease protein
MDELSSQHSRIHSLHPAAKLIAVILYILFTVSFQKYDLAGLFPMLLWPVLLYQISGISMITCFYRLRIVLPLVCIVGIFNPLLDRRPGAEILGFTLTMGLLSMLTLMIKGILTVLSSYLLVASTPVDDLCAAMRMIHIPRMIVVEFLLIWRYISLFMSEAEKTEEAYLLRAPGQKGIAMKNWGPLLGSMLLRSMDRASEVYEAMCLRGFTGDFPAGRIRKAGRRDLVFFVSFAAGILLLRIFPVLVLVGSLFAG